MSQAKRALAFFWKAGTRGVKGINEPSAQITVQDAISTKAISFPELAKATRASVDSRPHSTPKADGRTDPLHANFRITSDDGKSLVSVHYYPSPLGGEQVWFSKPKYNGGKQASEYFVKDESSAQLAK